MSNWNKYIAPNLGLLFYKRLYNEPFIKNILSVDTANEDKLKMSFKTKDNNSEFNAFYEDFYKNKLTDFAKNGKRIQIGNNGFTLHTTYPGLLVGSGYIHNTKSEGDATIGFFFDHTSGLPVIPGSSVKGVLHSMFESSDALIFIIKEVLTLEKDLPLEVKNNLHSIQTELLKNNATYLKTLSASIFGSFEQEGKDVFFDAHIHPELTDSEKFMGKDFITTHRDGPLKNPTPLQFIKVLPNVGFEFRFTLYNNIGLLTGDAKLLIFKHILLTLGIGAKTNVGYGQFNDLNNTKSSFTAAKNTIYKMGSVKELKKDDLLKAEVVQVGDAIKMKLIDIENAPILGIAKNRSVNYIKGQVYEVVVVENRKGNIKIAHTLNTSPI